MPTTDPLAPTRPEGASPRPIRCCLCSWLTCDPDGRVREEQWNQHYYGVHPQPLMTKCTAPPYCGWTGTAGDLDTLRRLHHEHEASHMSAPH